MKQVEVFGVAILDVTVSVKVPDDADHEDAIKAAAENFGGIKYYPGTDKLIGVTGEGESIIFNDEIEWLPQSELTNDPEYKPCPHCGV
ncbi:MAG: hypothetical protein ACW99J_19220 [Candidatus Thorarchaeota archaeon]